MNRFVFFLFIPFLVFLSSCYQEEQKPLPVNIIPIPVETVVRPGSVSFDRNIVLVYSVENDTLDKLVELLASQLNRATGFPINVDKLDKAGKNSIFLKLDNSLKEELGSEGYKFDSGNGRVEITAFSPTGIFYGIQTLFQLLPEEIYQGKVAETKTWKIPAVTITDYPRFSWRGMHLDVSRHFFPVDFLKKYIDLISMHKMNIFHWHLTDDNGWRIEIRQYPLLTEVAAWRVDRENEPWGGRKLQQPGEKATYGGFYTQDEIREVVKYAAERHITVIPEIEMPGHCSEVFSAFPELSCKGEKLTVQPGSYWPNTDIFCAGKEETFVFLENVLKEVASLFPSEYIHIGGDEADKTRWKACKHCQERIEKEQLSGEDELQSYFIRRIEKILNGLGKKLIGWDEILEGGLAPEATVMSWRGFEGGIEAARQGHDVIMCPTDYCYFDYYQADPEFQPEAIGGLTTLKKVYSLNPIPSELTGAEAKHILGGQGNVWTEYIQTPEKAEYMALPRMTALAEVLWSPAENLDWSDFRSRLQTQYDRFRIMNVNYSEGSAKVLINTSYDTIRNLMVVILENETLGMDIHYTLDGSEPDTNSALYHTPLQLESSVILKAVAYRNGKSFENPVTYQISEHLGIGCTMSYIENYSERYIARGIHTLNDGLKGSLAFNDGMWQGFNGNNLDVVIKLDNSDEIQSITASFLQDQKKWIFLPEQVVIHISKDGKNFGKLRITKHNIPQDTKDPVIYSFEIELDKPLTVNYIRVQAINMGKCPSWHPGKGQKSWIFADEIVIN